MSDASFASLSPSLLARKGGAKPAMRPQNTEGPVDGKQVAASLEDLGWNDMGDEDQKETSGQVVMLNAASAQDKPSSSPVRDSIEKIAQKLESNSAMADAKAPSNNKRNSRRAAFTLRLDHERHLKLRLACTVRGRSAQQLVTDALDALLGQMPEIDIIAAQVLRD